MNLFLRERKCVRMCTRGGAEGEGPRQTPTEQGAPSLEHGAQRPRWGSQAQS